MFREFPVKLNSLSRSLPTSFRQFCYTCVCVCVCVQTYTLFLHSLINKKTVHILFFICNAQSAQITTVFRLVQHLFWCLQHFCLFSVCVKVLTHCTVDSGAPSAFWKCTYHWILLIYFPFLWNTCSASSVQDGISVKTNLEQE